MSKNLICVHLVVDLEHAELDLELDPSFCSLRLDLLEKLLRKHRHDSWIDDFRKQTNFPIFYGSQCSEKWFHYNLIRSAVWSISRFLLN